MEELEIERVRLAADRKGRIERLRQSERAVQGAELTPEHSKQPREEIKELRDSLNEPTLEERMFHEQSMEYKNARDGLRQDTAILDKRRDGLRQEKAILDKKKKTLDERKDMLSKKVQCMQFCHVLLQFVFVPESVLRFLFSLFC
jgi:uncharacterized coiled-coil DUF342 family protein